MKNFLKSLKIILALRRMKYSGDYYKSLSLFQVIKLSFNYIKKEKK